MFQQNKDGHDITAVSTPDMSMSDKTQLVSPKKKKESKNVSKNKSVSFNYSSGPLISNSCEPHFPTYDESMASNQIGSSDINPRITNENMASNQIGSSDINPRITNENMSSPNGDPFFAKILMEQILHAFAIFYLSVSLTASVVYLTRQIAKNPDVANRTWYWVGLFRAIVTLSIVVVAVWYKRLLIGNPHNLQQIQPENIIFFYTCVVIPSVAPWLYYLIIELRYLKCINNCVIPPDYVIPIAQMIFVAVVITTAYDMTFYRINNACISSMFYTIYKIAATLVFINCITSLIFNVVDMEASYIQKQLPFSQRIVCQNVTDLSGIIDNFGRFLEVSTIIFFISSIAILIKPLRQFSVTINIRPDISTRNNLSSSNGPATSVGNHQYSATALMIALIFCICSIIVIPLDIMGKENKSMLYFTQLVFSGLPLLIYVVTVIISVYLLKLLYGYYRNQYEVNMSKIDTFIIWTSLLGRLISCFRDIINSSQFTMATSEERMKICNDKVYSDPQRCQDVHILVIVLRIGTIVQSMFQAVVLNFINVIKKKHILDKNKFEKISYPLVILIASNVGFFFVDWYLLSDASSFRSFPYEFNEIQWDFLASISSSLTLLFRGYCALCFVRILSKLRCVDN